jgi:hypothetical protein
MLGSALASTVFAGRCVPRHTRDARTADACVAGGAQSLTHTAVRSLPLFAGAFASAVRAAR